MFSCHWSNLEGGYAVVVVVVDVVVCGVSQAQKHAAVAVELVADGNKKAGTVASSTLAMMETGYVTELEERDGDVGGEVVGLAAEMSIFLR